MTTPRDPLVVIEALVKAGSELFAAWDAEVHPGGVNFHEKMWAFQAALSASAPMPAPEAKAPMDSCDRLYACYDACLAANLSPATLAADPEAIKRVVEALSACVAGMTPAEVLSAQMMGEAALRAIGKGEA